jgi:hypothetical protein
MLEVDHSKFTQALGRWDRLSADSHFSVPSECGTFAVILAYDHSRDVEHETIDTFPTYVAEANAIADRALAAGKKVELVINATRADFRAVLREPTISDVTVLGNGCLSAVELPNPDTRVDWKNVSRMADHLKTGVFTQRFCGTTPRLLNVPLGLMAVSSHQNVHAPLWKYFRPRHIDSSENRYIRPLLTRDRADIDTIIASFPQRHHVTARDIPRRIVDKVRVLRRSI